MKMSPHERERYLVQLCVRRCISEKVSVKWISYSTVQANIYIQMKFCNAITFTSRFISDVDKNPQRMIETLHNLVRKRSPIPSLWVIRTARFTYFLYLLARGKSVRANIYLQNLFKIKHGRRLLINCILKYVQKSGGSKETFM